MSKTVIALFENAGHAQRAVAALQASGFINERIQVQSGEEFMQRGNLPPEEHPHQGLYRGIRSFFDEIGLTSPRGPGAGERQPISRDDAVIVLETSDDRADAAAAVLDREGAVNVEERMEQEAAPEVPHYASGLEPKTSGRTPSDAAPAENDAGADAPERVKERVQSRRTRVYGPANEPYGDDWAPKGPRPYK